MYWDWMHGLSGNRLQRLFEWGSLFVIFVGRWGRWCTAIPIELASASSATTLSTPPITYPSNTSALCSARSASLRPPSFVVSTTICLSATSATAEDAFARRITAVWTWISTLAVPLLSTCPKSGRSFSTALFLRVAAAVRRQVGRLPVAAGWWRTNWMRLRRVWSSGRGEFLRNRKPHRRLRNRSYPVATVSSRPSLAIRNWKRRRLTVINCLSYLKDRPFKRWLPIATLFVFCFL